MHEVDRVKNVNRIVLRIFPRRKILQYSIPLQAFYPNENL